MVSRDFPDTHSTTVANGWQFAMTVKPVNGREGDDKERRQIIHKNVAFFTDNPELEQRVLYFYTFLRLWGRIVDPFLMMVTKETKYSKGVFHQKIHFIVLRIMRKVKRAAINTYKH